ncbi:serine/threonine protein kinase [Tropicimonas marinistellae]|uniref:serine/threonine protein kinase n=1 Tax=Tropicimonas marinistellae TaxID=1739787 RepID=UPI0008355C8C|nr:serine/threonine-protein kinase [Tropicimonas marinistellae]
MSAATERREPDTDKKQGDELPVGSTLLRGQYRIERYLNSGGFGITYLARNSLDRLVVLKECFPSFICYRSGKNVRVRSDANAKDYQALLDLFRKEARALAMLEHPNIVRVHEVFADNKTAYMALDFVEGKDLQSLIEDDREHFGPSRVRELMVTVLSAISHIHARGILHRDISPDNILIEKNGNPVLIDFGAARAQAARDASALQAVKDGYSPHEFYQSRGIHSPESDIYSLAATFHFAITGEAPPPSPDRLAAVAEGLPDPYEKLEARIERFDRPLLASLDKALSVLGRDRMQSANEWLLEIDDHSQTSQALEVARKDARIDQLVSELTRQTNTELARILEEDRQREEMEAARRAEEAELLRNSETVKEESVDGAYPFPDSLPDVQNPTPDSQEIETFGRAPVETVVPPQAPEYVDYIAMIAKRSEERRAEQERLAREAQEPVPVTKSLVEKALWTIGPLFAEDPTQLAGRAEQ